MLLEPEPTAATPSVRWVEASAKGRSRDHNHGFGPQSGI